MRYISRGIFQLLGTQRAQLPVGQTAGFIQFHPAVGSNQIFITDTFAQTAGLRRYLGVKNRRRHRTGKVVQNLNILTAGMKNFQYFFILQQGKEIAEVHIFCQRVYQKSAVFITDLNQAGNGKKCLFTDKFAIYGYNFLFF